MINHSLEARNGVLSERLSGVEKINKMNEDMIVLFNQPFAFVL